MAWEKDFRKRSHRLQLVLDELGILAYDTFKRPDATSLGLADSGQSWRVVQGTWGISSNAAYQATNTANACAVVDVGESNVTVSVTMKVSGNSGIYFRVSDANNRLRLVRDGNIVYLQKIVSGSITTLGSFPAPPIAGDVYKVELQDENIKAFLNDSQIFNIAESFNQTETKHGIGPATGSTVVRYVSFKVERMPS